MVRVAMLVVTMIWASPGFAQQSNGPLLRSAPAEPQLELHERNFALPVIDYRAPDGTWKRGSGIIVGHDLSPNATVGIGFFKMKPKFQDPAAPALPTAGKSKKVSLGFSLRF